MYSELNEKIEKAQRGIARLQKIDSILKQLELEMESVRRKASELRATLDKENKDVDKLEHKSIVSVFYSILGNLDEHVEKERKEALAAKLKYDQAERDLEDINNHISILVSEREEYVGCQQEYDRLYAQKKEELTRRNDATAQKLLGLTENLNLAIIERKETEEALTAGKKVLESLDSVLSSLDSAEGWGTFDLLGGGLISDMAKHSHIDDAKAETENTQRLLRQFKSELTDIRINSEIVIETDGFAKFADFFFDGLIADWFMQSRINESQASVEKVKSQVLSIIGRLKNHQSEQNNNIDWIEARIRELILKA